MTDGVRGAVEPRDLLRYAILFLLLAGPLALGAVHEAASIPLLAVAYTTGLLSWARGHWARAHGAAVPLVPGRGPLLALCALVLLQLLPLPPRLLRLLSPGSFSYYDDVALLPLADWKPISVSPPDTLRGLLFLGGMGLLYATVFREFDETRWRRRLIWTVVDAGLLITLVALIQAASSEPRKIYGLWRPRWDWGVFGPYVGRNNFAGYVVMTIPLALAFAAQSLQELRRGWARRKRARWLALGDRAGTATVARAAVALALIIGLLSSQSRGGLVAFLLSTSTLGLALWSRRRAAAGIVLVAVVALAGTSWIGLDAFVHGFEQRGIRTSRLELWHDALRLVPHFPLLGAGFNAFGTSYPPYQTYFKDVWWGEAHNEYLQSLIDTGLVGAGLAGMLIVRLFGAALRGAQRGTLEAGLLGALLALGFHNLFDFSWQIPANAATFAALSGLALRPSAAADSNEWRRLDRELHST